MVQVVILSKRKRGVSYTLKMTVKTISYKTVTSIYFQYSSITITSRLKPIEPKK